MNYLVLMKQVPKFSKVRLDPETHNLIREGLQVIVNPSDLNALELAIQVKKDNGGKITVLTMGPDVAAEMVQEAIARGADDGYVLSSLAFRGSDTLATSYALSKAIESIGTFDMVFCGTNTLDGDTAQVGPEVAEHLGLNQCTYVKSLSVKDGQITALRALEGRIEKQKLPTPALLTVMRNDDEVGKISKDKVNSVPASKVTIISDKDIDAAADRLGAAGSPTIVNEVFDTERRATGTHLEGSVDKQVEELVAILQREHILGRDA
ncbi:electron transfer flavoprotein subunit beta/FixA family protein [Peptoniphilus equinus]|uniref:Electron transfer flavoprotein small subunit n=1 Tax=Peptoniphilus equinus TaxID=3016343 RepID=A0ABY7QUI8_9FIRM|nr:electron transfer flavoprotein subunit beta/FixA family protein [Peptoniphilus equinus]WBW50452.1 electron transfer flavoprotein subunit beta/FixA family protein [Peptoniphilus equinus]